MFYDEGEVMICVCGAESTTSLTASDDEIQAWRCPRCGRSFSDNCLHGDMQEMKRKAWIDAERTAEKAEEYARNMRMRARVLDQEYHKGEMGYYEDKDGWGVRR